MLRTVPVSGAAVQALRAETLDGSITASLPDAHDGGQRSAHRDALELGVSTVERTRGRELESSGNVLSSRHQPARGPCLRENTRPARGGARGAAIAFSQFTRMNPCSWCPHRKYSLSSRVTKRGSGASRPRRYGTNAATTRIVPLERRQSVSAHRD